MAHRLTAKEKKELRALYMAFDAAKAALFDAIQERQSELQEAFDEKSERWQGSSAGEAAREVLDNLQAVADEVENCEVDLDAVTGAA